MNNQTSMQNDNQGESAEQTQQNQVTPPADQGTQVPEGSENQAAPAETPQEAPQDDFPKDEREQRKAFYEMRKKIKDYEEKDQQGQDDIDLLDLARSTPTTPQTQGVMPPNADQGMFDTSDPATQAFVNKAQRAEYEAQAARQDAQRAQAQVEDFEAWQKYPFLNPRSTRTDEQKIFVDDVQKEYIAARLKAVAQGKPAPRLVEVAEKIHNRHEKIRGQAREQGKEEEANTQAAKSAATIESRGTQVNLQGQGEDIESLRRRVHRGDIDAQAELLKKTDPFLAEWPE